MKRKIYLPFIDPYIDVQDTSEIKMSPMIDPDAKYLIHNQHGSPQITCSGKEMSEFKNVSVRIVQSMSIKIAHEHGEYNVHRSHILVKGVDYE